MLATEVLPGRFLRAARDYAAQGWAVIPIYVPDPSQPGGCSCGRPACDSPAKHPTPTRGVLQASRRDRQLESWAAAQPDANIGIRAGAESDLIVLDIDSRHGGLGSLADLERRHGPLPATRRARTGTGGYHYLFRHPGEGKVGNSVGALGAGVDVRGDGGYIVAPPSLHVSGGRYEWVDEAAVAELPAAWVALLARPRDPALAVVPISTPDSEDGPYWLDQALLRAREGNRNATGFWLACQLRDCGLSEGETADWLTQYAGHLGGDYTAREALHSVGNAYKQGAREKAKGRNTGGPVLVRGAHGQLVNRDTGEVVEEENREGGQESENAAPDPAPQAKKKGGRDLLDAGRRWYALHHEEWSFDRHTHLWRHWTGTHHEEEPRPSTLLDSQAMTILRQVKMEVSSGSRIDGCIRAAAALSVREFERPDGQVNFVNGTLDTATWELNGHDREHGFTYCLAYPWERRPCPKIMAFLEQTIPDPIGVQAFMIHIGLALLHDTRIHKTLILIGPPRSGKSTCLALANAVCGQDPFGNAGPELFSRETEGLRSRATWNGRRLVTLEELPVEALRNEEIIKAMVAHGGVPMRQLWQREALENRWRPKVLMATNEKPRYSDRTGALTKRIIALSCPNGRPDTAIDPFLLDELLSDLSGFAATCLDLASDLLAGGGLFPMSDAMRELLTEIEQQGDSLKGWVRDCCLLDTEVWQGTGSLYLGYRQFCEQNGNKPMAKERFSSALCERYANVFPSRHRINGKLERCIGGIQIVSETEENEVAF